MNWLGWTWRSVLGSLLGCSLGTVLYVYLLGIGHDFPWIVGIFAGFGSAISSDDTSGLRGISVGAFSVWCSAVARLVIHPEGRSLVPGLLRFSDTLDVWGLLAFLACMGTATYLGSRSFRRGATTRIAGT